jgi:hypothetical protein
MTLSELREVALSYLESFDPDLSAWAATTLEVVNVLELVHGALDGKEWSSSTTEEIAAHISSLEGLTVREADGWTCDECHQRIVSDEFVSEDHADWCSGHPKNVVDPSKSD